MCQLFHESVLAERRGIMVYVFFNSFNQSVLNMDDFVRLVCYSTFMSDDNNCQSLVFMQFFQNIHHFHGCFAVQGSGRFIGKEGNENEPKIKALVAALQSQQVKDFMDENYKGAVVSVVETPTDGYDASIDYDALNGETVSCAATPAPHCEVLEVCKDILAAKGITLDIQEYDDYVIPNTIVEDGQCDTNYFQHQPYLDNFNEEKGTHLVTITGIHVEPMGIYGRRWKTVIARWQS